MMQVKQAQKKVSGKKKAPTSSLCTSFYALIVSIQKLEIFKVVLWNLHANLQKSKNKLL